MIFRSRVNVAICVISHLRHIENNKENLQQISKSVGVTVSYLEQTMTKLVALNIVKGIRGPGGGYQLLTENGIFTFRRCTIKDLNRAYYPNCDKTAENCLSSLIKETPLYQIIV